MNNKRSICCPICESGQYITTKWPNLRYQKNEINFKYSLYTCKSCDLHFIHPLPSDEMLDKIYDPDNYAPYGYNNIESLLLTKLKSKVSSFKYSHLISNRKRFLRVISLMIEVVFGRSFLPSLGIVLNLPKSSSILDFGYGNGSWLLSHRKKGYTNLFGFDIANNNENIQRLKLNSINIISYEDISSGRFYQSFDQIHLEQVLEHLKNPKQILSQLMDTLKPGGELIITVPCKSSIIYSVIKSGDTRLVKLPIHITHNSINSLKQICVLLKMHCYKTFLHPNITVIYSAFARRYPFLKYFKILFYLCSPFYFIIAKIFYLGEFCSVYIKKDID